MAVSSCCAALICCQTKTTPSLQLVLCSTGLHAIACVDVKFVATTNGAYACQVSIGLLTLLGAIKGKVLDGHLGI